jgi:hypothetical protein
MMTDERLKQVVSDDYLDVMAQMGTINDIPDMIAAIRAQRKELESLRLFVQIAVESKATDTTTMALYMGAKKMRAFAKKVALLHNAYAVAEHIEGLPLPGQTEQGGFGEH